MGIQLKAKQTRLEENNKGGLLKQLGFSIF